MDVRRIEAILRRAVADFNAATAGGIAVTIDGAGNDGRQLSRLLVGLDATIDDLPRALEDTVPAIRAAFAANFSAGGGRTAWAPLAPSTRAERVRLGYPAARPILVRSGGLRRHVLAAPARIARAGDTVQLRIKPGRFVPGTGASYYLLGAGGQGGRGASIPARPMVTIKPASANAITGALTRAVRARAVSNGLG